MDTKIHLLIQTCPIALLAWTIARAYGGGRTTTLAMSATACIGIVAILTSAWLLLQPEVVMGWLASSPWMTIGAIAATVLAWQGALLASAISISRWRGPLLGR